MLDLTSSPDRRAAAAQGRRPRRLAAQGGCVGACALLLCALVSATRAGASGGAEPPLRVQIDAPETILPGAHTQLRVIVDFAAPNDEPLLLTPSSQGNAIEIVRGRLSRSDAQRVSATRLRFELPVLAHGEGTAIVHVELSAYVCSTRCRRVVSGSERAIRVAGR